jgi:hypothetical protein
VRGDGERPVLDGGGCWQLAGNLLHWRLGGYLVAVRIQNGTAPSTHRSSSTFLAVGRTLNAVHV